MNSEPALPESATDKLTIQGIRVSVVLPTCNRSERLERCLQSLAKQSMAGYEVIVVDDGSTDKTPETVENFARSHPNLHLVSLRHEQNSGANASRNLGISRAQGDLVALIDDDIVAEQDWLEQLVAVFDDPEVTAATGAVIDPEPANIYELTYKGTHRIRPGLAMRLVGCNMCVRKPALLKYGFDLDRATTARTRDGQPDMRVSGRGDEEGLYLQLKAAGHKMVVATEAAVFHDHRYDRRSFFKQAWRGGRSASRLVYKFYLPPRLDLLPFLCAYLSLPLLFVDVRIIFLSLGFLLLGCAALTYNELYRKAKSYWETVICFPVLLIYYHLRLAGYTSEWLRLRLALVLGRSTIARQRLINNR